MRRFENKPVSVALRIAFWLIVSALTLASSSVSLTQKLDQVGRFSRAYEFDYLEWELSSLFHKAVQAATRADKLLSTEQQKRVVLSYMDATRQQAELESDLKKLIADPNVKDTLKIEAQSQKLHNETVYLNQLSIIAEPTLQSQTELTLANLGFGLGGQVLPPVLFEVSKMPLNLIISPRDRIETIHSVSLDPNLELADRDAIESEILHDLDYSALVEPIGGLGAYPTMIMRTSDLTWLTNTIAHEWSHNWLTFHRLGIRYFNSPELRTMNETVASIAGKDVSADLLRRWYPEFAPQAEPLAGSTPLQEEPQEDANAFNYRKEMHKTRVRVDELLAQGQITEAETYMEDRRKVFWDQGYYLRKINQAYFAFYGSYNDAPGGGASGNDPVGPAVQAYRKRFSNVAAFLKAISNLGSFEELQRRLN